MSIRPEVRIDAQPAELLELAPSRRDDMNHAYLPGLRGGEVGCPQRDVADVATGQIELRRQERQVHVGCERGIGWPNPLPDLQPERLCRWAELDAEVQPPQEGAI